MDDLELAIAAAETGGVIVRNHFGSVRGETSKGRNNPVTDADRDNFRRARFLLQARPL